MNLRKIVLPLILSLSFLFVACQQSTQTPENSENTGEAVEDAGEDAGEAIEDAGDDASDALEDAGDSVEDATN